jgi:hypothetical protein
MFVKWSETQSKKTAAVEAKEAAAAAADTKDGKKKGKDDKKEKKDDKKKDKDDKKDKKDKDDKKDDKKDGAFTARSSKEENYEKEPATFKMAKEVDVLWSGVGADEFAFQLMYSGPHMERVAGTAKDEKGRVNFRPDGWQRDLLDIVDDRRSALVVAPTASGKTFVGYYVMDQILREDNDGVAVYVAPSKALVNQVSAEIYARFSSKPYPAHSKHELLGVFLREFNSAGGYRDPGKWKNCQVLVTIPHILEMLLLSPSHQEWVKRLRYIVFDEVHCIGEQEGGVQWEHCFQMIPCPFIALSATVADPFFFHNWLSNVSKKKGQASVELVQYSERWNDLYKHIFVNNTVRRLHPFCCLVEQAVRTTGFSADLTLTPQEMVQLFLEVRRIVGKNADWDLLAPITFFATALEGKALISKKAARAYEKELKTQFLSLVRNRVLTSDGFAQMVKALQGDATELDVDGSQTAFSPPPRTAEAAAEEENKVEEQDEALVAASGMKDFTTLHRSNSYLQGPTLYRLCKSLQEEDNLPVIIFNFAKKDIDRMRAKLVQELVDKQYFKYWGTEEVAYKSKRINEKRMAEYEKKMTAWEQAMKAGASKNQENSARRAQGEEGGEGRAVAKESVDTRGDMEMDEPEPPVNIEDEIDMEFSFHSVKALGIWQDDIKDMFKELKFRGVPEPLLTGLRRGIGMHHEGCSTKYKDAVEVLFRRGYLRVVFATGTLALGINMPCRTTVFCGDSLELNGLMYRQMSGRAGRRGFDLQGQVVFWDMAFAKIQRLVSSDLSNLVGEFVQSPTCLLRALQGWEQSQLMDQQDKASEKPRDSAMVRSLADIARCFTPVFSLPFFKSDKVELETQVLYYTRFSIELLVRERLLDREVKTCGLANLVSHLFEIEPANLVLARLLTSGVLHDYLVKEEKKYKKSERKTHLTVKLTNILSWFLYRRRLPATYAKWHPRKKNRPSDDCPALKPLPPKILEEVNKYNSNVFSCFQDLAFAVSTTKKMGPDDFTLPYTNQVFSAQFDSRGAGFGDGYKALILRQRLRSPFSAMTGLGDALESPHDLVKYTRCVTHFDLNSVPMVAPAVDTLGMLEATNSWAVDFMIHGKIKHLLEDNAINSTKAYKFITNFIEAVKMLTAVLKIYAPSDDIVLKTLELLHTEMQKILWGDSKTA